MVHGLQNTTMSVVVRRLCACTRQVLWRCSEGCEKGEVITRGNEVVAACLTTVGEWRQLTKTPSYNNENEDNEENAD